MFVFVKIEWEPLRDRRTFSNVSYETKRTYSLFSI